jgi:hypothetical protein
MAWALYELAGVAYSQSDYAQSSLLNSEALCIFVEQGARPGISHAHCRMGRDRHHLGHYAEASQLYSQALSEAAEIELQSAIGQAIAGIAGVAAALGRPRDAAVLFGSAHAILARLYSSLEREAMTLNMEEARSALGEEEWKAAWAEGAALSWKQAAALATAVRIA